ncbi:MAG: phage tail assembly protein [Roseburia sp.]|nr:phage tail assembly protein [Roseburia sp.]
MNDQDKTVIPTPDTIDPAEFAALEKEAAASEAAVEDSLFTYEHHFSRPFTYEGKTYETLTFDFGKLTGKDALAIQDTLDAQGKAVVVKQMNDNYLLQVAARACTTPIAANVIAAMPLYEFNKITKKARSFLLHSGL